MSANIFLWYKGLNPRTPILSYTSDLFIFHFDAQSLTKWLICSSWAWIYSPPVSSSQSTVFTFVHQHTWHASHYFHHLPAPAQSPGILMETWFTSIRPLLNILLWLLTRPSSDIFWLSKKMNVWVSQWFHLSATKMYLLWVDFFYKQCDLASPWDSAKRKGRK